MAGFATGLAKRGVTADTESGREREGTHLDCHPRTVVDRVGNCVACGGGRDIRRGRSSGRG
ncbi:MAG: hypothetical protein CMO64_02385, partial [Verrucomicrobiales bacterium]|nr:hypothetical protein [Verrucomicrobiales bacterium]